VNKGSKTLVKDYQKLFTEQVLDYSRQKHYINGKPTLLVLLRALKYRKSVECKGKEVAKELGLKAPCHNPFLNTASSAVEWVHCLRTQYKY